MPSTVASWKERKVENHESVLDTLLMQVGTGKVLAINRKKIPRSLKWPLSENKLQSLLWYVAWQWGWVRIHPPDCTEDEVFLMKAYGDYEGWIRSIEGSWGTLTDADKIRARRCIKEAYEGGQTRQIGLILHAYFAPYLPQVEATLRQLLEVPPNREPLPEPAYFEDKVTHLPERETLFQALEAHKLL